MNVTFESFVTPEGVIIAAGTVTALVQLIKTVFPIVDAKVSGALLAFAGSAALYGVTAASIGVTSPDEGLGIALAWLACATSAVGIKATFEHVKPAT